ncbi:MAG: hypothetical protein Q9225_005555 [Loekoesia sp. 1 TL-2023]
MSSKTYTVDEDGLEMQIIKTPHFEYQFYTHDDHWNKTAYYNNKEWEHHDYDRQYLKKLGSWLQMAAVRGDYKESAYIVWQKHMMELVHKIDALHKEIEDIIDDIWKEWKYVGNWDYDCK